MSEIRDLIINAVETYNPKSEMFSSLLKYLSTDDLVDWFVSNDFDEEYTCGLSKKQIQEIRDYYFLHCE